MTPLPGAVSAVALQEGGGGLADSPQRQPARDAGRGPQARVGWTETGGAFRRAGRQARGAAVGLCLLTAPQGGSMAAKKRDDSGTYRSILLWVFRHGRPDPATGDLLFTQAD